MNGSLLQELVAFAATSDQIAPPNYDSKTLCWQLVIDADGHPRTDLRPLIGEPRKNGKAKEKRGREFVVPKMDRPGTTPPPMLGPDDIRYVFGWNADEASTTDRAKTAARHEAYLQLHRAWAEAVDPATDPTPHIFLNFLDNHLDQVTRPEGWKTEDGVLITVDGTHLHESPSAAGFWANRVGDAKLSGRTDVCLVCGTTGRLVKVFPQKVRGTLVPGGHTSGIAPVSINAAPFGYDLKADLSNVPICERCAYAVPAALNALLADTSHTRKDARTATTWWVRGDDSIDDLMALLEGTPDTATVENLLSTVSVGRPEQDKRDLSQFNSLVVSGNGPRLVVNRWYRVPVDEIRANIAAWFADTQIQSRFLDGREFHPLTTLAQATGRFQREAGTSKGKYAAPWDRDPTRPEDIVERLHACAFERATLPSQVLAHLLQRIGADHRVDEPRAALLRLALTRNPHVKETIMPGLDPENTSPCYVAGRLFAAYDDLQSRSVYAEKGQLNATFADKHLAGAISAPRLALAAGEKQSTAWLSKLRRARPGTAHAVQQHIDDIVSLLSPSDPIPARASLEEQALFVMGYHHERAATSRAQAEGVAKKAQNAESTPDTPTA